MSAGSVSRLELDGSSAAKKTLATNGSEVWQSLWYIYLYFFVFVCITPLMSYILIFGEGQRSGGGGWPWPWSLARSVARSERVPENGYRALFPLVSVSVTYVRPQLTRKIWLFPPARGRQNGVNPQDTLAFSTFSITRPFIFWKWCN